MAFSSFYFEQNEEKLLEKEFSKGKIIFEVDRSINNKTFVLEQTNIKGRSNEIMNIECFPSE